MLRNQFAHSQLKKHGWKEGAGLGKHESGIKEAIKVKIKNDTKGVGHDPGAEFTCHWWDHAFNKAASSIKVQDTEDGVSLKKSSKVGGNKKTKTLDNKAMLYGKFVKAATLSNGSYETVPKPSNHCSDEEEITAKHTAIIPANEEEIFRKCGGRTAHKAARHGNKLNGKLLRIQEQERQLLESMNKRKTSAAPNLVSSETSLQDSNHVTANQISCQPLLQDPSHVTSNADKVSDRKESKKKKKEKKRKKRDLEESVDTERTEEILSFKTEDKEVETECTELTRSKKKKKSKRKRQLEQSRENIEDLPQEKQPKK